MIYNILSWFIAHLGVRPKQLPIILKFITICYKPYIGTKAQLAAELLYI